MKIRQIRNATLLLDYTDDGIDLKILIDPMLARAGSIPSLKWITRSRRRNPLVELPEQTNDILESVTHVLITHCQKGHFDHLDRAGVKWIRQRQLPVLCETHDEQYLKNLGLDARAFNAQKINTFSGGKISLVPCRHGEGFVGSMMAHGHGYILDFPNSPKTYIIGDSILSNEVRKALQEHQPDIVIMPGGGAQFDIGGEIIMGLDDILPMAELSPRTLIVNHLEALDHCPVTREQVRELAKKNHLAEKIRVPLDGEELEFKKFDRNKTT